MEKKKGFLKIVLTTLLASLLLLFIPHLVFAATADPIFAQTCAGNNRGVAGSFPAACAGTYPAACGTTGDRLTCDDGITETFSTQNDFAGVEISSFNSSVTSCASVTRVDICYEWWRSFTQTVGGCEVAVDANAGASYSVAATTCPGTTANPGVTCVDVTSLETWTCNNFFGATGTRAQAYMQASKTQGQGGAGNILFDVLYFRVNYTQADITPPTVTLISPTNNSWALSNPITFSYLPIDDVAVANCTLYINETINQVDTSITNNATNTFSASLPDGNSTWRVSCTDTSSNTNTSETRNIRVDTTPPIVNLEAPIDSFVSSQNDVTFFYNATDAQTTLAACSLRINGSTVQTTMSPPKDTSLNFTWTLANGVYSWTVRCTDSNDFVTTATARTITIDSPTPAITPGQAAYELGDLATITGSNFESLEEVTIEYTLPNSTVITDLRTASSTGSFMSTLNIGYNHPLGSYQVFAYTTSDPSINSSTSFEVTLPATTLQATPITILQGDPLTIIGLSYPINDPLTIVLTFSDLSTDTTTSTTNSTGGFTTTYDLSYTAPIGSTDLFGSSDEYPHINASTTISINERIATLTTNKAVYVRNENVNIEGVLFSRAGTTTLTIFDDNNNATPTGFPLNKTNNATGGFTHTWNTANTCNGEYRIEAQDTEQSQLEDTIFFTIEEFVTSDDVALVTSGTRSTGGAITVSNVNESDGVYETQTQGGGAGATLYYEFNFANSLNPSLEIEEVVWTIEHLETAGYGNAQLLVWDGASYVSTPCPALSASTTIVTQSCDITSSFADINALNSASLRFQLTKTGGGGQTSNVDFTSLNITVRYEPSCIYLNGTPSGGLAANPPLVEEVTLTDELSTPDDELNLIAGSTTTFYCNSTVSDGDGFADIEGVSATLFHESVSFSDPNNPLNHYTNSSCEFISGSGFEADYSCTFNVEYYALPGGWTCRVTASDGDDSATGTTTATLNELYALNLSSTLLNYGDFELGTISDEQIMSVLNIGNTPINLSTYAYGQTIGDGLAMVCDQNNIPLSAKRYSLTTTPYESKTIVSPTIQNIGLLVNSQTSPGSPPQENTYWQLRATPESEPFGSCTGTLVFEASP